MAKSKRQRRQAKKARQAAKAAARAAGAPKPSKSALRKITRQTVKKSSAPSNKQKTQNYIRKIISDGKVSKSEVNKAIKKGINPDRIKGAAEKYTEPGNPFSRPAGLKGLSKTPQSITITPGAGKLISRGIPPKPIASFPTPGFTPDGQGRLPLEEEGYRSPEFEALMEQNSLLQQQLDNLPDFESIFAQQAEQAAQQRADDLAQMQQQQALAMEELAARQAEQERQRLLTAQTQQANMARAGMTPDFSIGGRARTDLYGTGGFKRRRRIRPATIAQGIAAPAATGNLLNV